MHHKVKSLFLGLMFFTPLLLNCAQLALERPPDTPIHTKPTCWQGHSIHCWEHQGFLILSHTYPPGAQPTWGYKNETRQLFCYHHQDNPFVIIDIPLHETQIDIHFPHPTGTNHIFTGRPVINCRFFHNPQTNTYSIVLVRRQNLQQQVVAQQ